MSIWDAIAAMAGGSRKGNVDLSDAFLSFDRFNRHEYCSTGMVYPTILQRDFNLVPSDSIIHRLNHCGLSDALHVSNFVESVLKENPEVFRDYEEYTFTVKKFDKTPLVKINIFTGKALSEISDFNHTNKSNSSGLDGDVVLYSKGNTIAIHRVKVSKEIGWAYDEYTIGFDTIMDYGNLTEYPKGIDYRTPLTLNKGHIDHHVICEGDIAEITINGDSSILSWMPINITNCRKLVIRGEGCLKILATNDYQPCIGCYTDVDYRLDFCKVGPEIKCEEIVIDGVDVILKGKEPNFTIGRYGTNDMVKINLINGGKLTCPEMKGERACKVNGIVQETYYSIK